MIWKYIYFFVSTGKRLDEPDEPEDCTLEEDSVDGQVLRHIKLLMDMIYVTGLGYFA